MLVDTPTGCLELNEAPSHFPAAASISQTPSFGMKFSHLYAPSSSQNPHVARHAVLTNPVMFITISTSSAIPFGPLLLSLGPFPLGPFLGPFLGTFPLGPFIPFGKHSSLNSAHHVG